MAQNITLFKTQYVGAESVDLPKTGGGTARFSDASVTTATAADVASGKKFLKADGTIGTGTNSGGGGSSAKVERGACTMTTSLLTIPHTLGVKPDFVIVWGTATGTNTQKTHSVVYDSKVSTSSARYQYYRSDAGISKNVGSSKSSTSTVYIGADAVTIPYYSSSYTFQGSYNYIVGTY